MKVHAVHLGAADAVVARFHDLLAPDEHLRRGRFRFPHLQDSFTLARGALRILLGHYLGVTPGAIPLRYGSKGKPGLAESARLRFNLSHSGGLALFAFTQDCEIGIDVEQIRSLPEMEQIATHQFSAQEAAELMALPAGRREPAFFRCWTRMEAYGKALGEGLTGDRLMVRRAEEDAWTLHDLDVPQPFAAALAYLDETRPLELLPAVEAAQLLELR